MDHTEQFDRGTQLSTFTDYWGLPADRERSPDSQRRDASSSTAVRGESDRIELRQAVDAKGGESGRSGSRSSEANEGPSTTKKSQTKRLIERLEECAPSLADADAKLLRLCAKQLDRCRESRCGRPACPRCAGRKARRFRARIERTMKARAADAQHGFALFTCTLAAADPESGYRALVKASSVLRRRKVFRDCFAGGELHIQVEPTDSADDRARWNPHIHGIVELRAPLHSIPVERLKEAWTAILAKGDRVGSLDVAQRENLRPARRVHRG